MQFRFLVVSLALAGAGCVQVPTTPVESLSGEPEGPEHFNLSLHVPHSLTSASQVNFDIDGDGIDEYAVRYTVPHIEILPGVFDTVHYVRVFRFQNNEWQVIKEDERHESTGAGQIGQFCLFNRASFENVPNEFLLVSKCHAWGANEGYYLYGQTAPGEFGDIDIPKGYLNEDLYLTEPGDRSLGLEDVDVVSDGLIERYGVACDDKPDTYSHFGGEDAGFCRTLNVKQTFDGTQFLMTPTVVPDEVPVTPMPYAPVFDGVRVQEGDQVRSMTLDSYTCSVYADCSFVFSGDVELTGRYEVYGEDVAFFSEKVCFSDLDESSLAKMPIEETDMRDVWFCFIDSEDAKTLFPSTSGTATIVIDTYYVIMAGKEVWNSAELVRVIDAN